LPVAPLTLRELELVLGPLGVEGQSPCRPAKSERDNRVRLVVSGLDASGLEEPGAMPSCAVATSTFASNCEDKRATNSRDGLEGLRSGG